MTYLPSLATAKPPAFNESAQILCHYINGASDAKIIRMMSGLTYYFERFIFPKERILLAAFPRSCLEICSGVCNNIQSSKIDSTLSQVNEKLGVETSSQEP